jgi:hypothetical protein
LPIIHRTPGECFSRFRNHVSKLITQTLDATALVRVDHVDDRVGTLHCNWQGDHPIPLTLSTTDYGKVYVYLSQGLETIDDGGKFRLQTQKYWYRLHDKPGDKEPAAIRWEYDRSVPKSAFCRHHIQGPIEVPFGDGSMDLDKLHLASGWVTLEEVIRFLIHELHVRPPCGRRWPEVLATSEETFYKKFSGKSMSSHRRA